jgi:type I restriction enzyme S subunit
MKTELPDGWKLMKLVDVSTSIAAGGTPLRAQREYWDNGTINWLKISDMKSTYISKTEEKITEKGLENSSAKLFPKGTIVYSIFATLGAIGILSIQCTTNQAIVGIVPNEKIILRKYLYYCLQAEKAHILSKKSHATQDNLNLTILKNHEIPIPELPVQQKIISILEKAERLIELRKNANRLTSEFVQSSFNTLFGNPKNNHKKLSMGKIRDLVISADYGSSQKASEKDGNFPILRMNNITYAGKWEFGDLKYINIEDDESKYLVNYGDLLFNRTNSKELVGKCAVFRMKKPMAFAGYLVKLKTKNKAISEYIAAYLNSTYGKAILFNKAKNIVGMANINAQEVQEIPILMPRDSYALKKFNDIVDSVEKLYNYQNQSEIEISNLFNSIMIFAFKGGIVC